MFMNYDLMNLITPVKIDKLEELLKETKYDEGKTREIVTGFKYGFPLGYKGRRKDIQKGAPNLKLRIGDEVDLWNKVMKEVKLKIYAGPYPTVPFKDYIQSPIGLVPKDGGRNTRLIFHLSYPKTRDSSSVNACMPRKDCTVKYPDFEAAIRCLEEDSEEVSVGKTDLSSAFRFVPMRKKDWAFLVMKARNPIDKKWYFFIDKCMPFGSSRSCANFQLISDALANIHKIKTGGKTTINYLDDFFFAAICKLLCDQQVKQFINMCDYVGIPVSLEKTEWGSEVIVFLGILIDVRNKIIGILVDKIQKGKEQIALVLKSRKIKIHQLQRLCGFLNFLCKCIIPGRALTRRLYAHTCGNNLKQHHHIRVTREMRLDLEMWNAFLNMPEVYCRPFMDFTRWTADELNFYMDVTRNFSLGFGGVRGTEWMKGT